jgi:hypothetical protein
VSQHVSKAFVVSVLIPVEKGRSHRESFVVGCSTRDEAEAAIASLYSSDLSIRPFALALSVIETERLELTAGEIRPWQ